MENYRDLYKDAFLDKINKLHAHPKYGWLKEQADIALRNRGDSLPGIAVEDFMDRIIAMPVQCIEDWLDGKNGLEWNEQYKKMLAAVKGGFVDVLEKYPDAEIHSIAKSATTFYANCGYEIIEDDTHFILNNNEYNIHRILAVNFRPGLYKSYRR